MGNVASHLVGGPVEEPEAWRWWRPTADNQRPTVVMDDEEEKICGVCRDQITDKAFLNRCLHRFCRGCIEQWSQWHSRCPLCRSAFNKLFVNVRSSSDYDEVTAQGKLEPVQVKVVDNGQVDLFIQEELFPKLTNRNSWYFLVFGSSALMRTPPDTGLYLTWLRSAGLPKKHLEEVIEANEDENSFCHMYFEEDSTFLIKNYSEKMWLMTEKAFDQLTGDDEEVDEEVDEEEAEQIDDVTGVWDELEFECRWPLLSLAKRMFKRKRTVADFEFVAIDNEMADDLIQEKLMKPKLMGNLLTHQDNWFVMATGTSVVFRTPQFESEWYLGHPMVVDMHMIPEHSNQPQNGPNYVWKGRKLRNNRTHLIKNLDPMTVFVRLEDWDKHYQTNLTQPLKSNSSFERYLFAFGVYSLVLLILTLLLRLTRHNWLAQSTFDRMTRDPIDNFVDYFINLLANVTVGWLLSRRRRWKLFRRVLAIITVGIVVEFGFLAVGWCLGLDQVIRSTLGHWAAVVAGVVIPSSVIVAVGKLI